MSTSRHRVTHHPDPEVTTRPSTGTCRDVNVLARPWCQQHYKYPWETSTQRHHALNDPSAKASYRDIQHDAWRKYVTRAAGTSTGSLSHPDQHQSIWSYSLRPPARGYYSYIYDPQHSRYMCGLLLGIFLRVLWRVKCYAYAWHMSIQLTPSRIDSTIHT